MLSTHEERLLADFLTRARGMSTLNLGAGLVACGAAFAIGAPQWTIALLAALGGALIGVSLEKRYLQEMRGVIEKLASPAQTGAPIDGV